jgi:hypothetical protein
VELSWSLLHDVRYGLRLKNAVEPRTGFFQGPYKLDRPLVTFVTYPAVQIAATMRARKGPQEASWHLSFVL